MGNQDKTVKYYPKSKTLRELENLTLIELTGILYKANCTVQWAEKHIRKDVSRPNSKLVQKNNFKILF